MKKIRTQKSEAAIGQRAAEIINEDDELFESTIRLHSNFSPTN